MSQMWMNIRTKIKYVRMKRASNENGQKHKDKICQNKRWFKCECTDRKYVRMKHDTNENVYRNTKRRYPRKKCESNVNAQMHKEKICKNERWFKFVWVMIQLGKRSYFLTRPIYFLHSHFSGLHLQFSFFLFQCLYCFNLKIETYSETRL